MQLLNRQNANIPAAYPERILQFGGGNFLRGFADWMIDVLNDKTGAQLGIVVVKPTERGDYDEWRHQDGLFHVRTKGVRNGALVLNVVDTRASLLGATRHLLERRRSHVEELARALHAFSPLATLARGYAVLVESRSGQVVRRTGQVAPGDRLRAILADGELPLRVDTED